MNFRLLSLAVCLIVPGLQSYAQDRIVDSSFGYKGWSTLSIDSSNAENNSFVNLADGKIITVGNCRKPDSSFIVLAKYTKDGSLDLSFGVEGIVTTKVLKYCNAYAIALQSDGKILITGEVSNGISSSLLVIRYTPNGVLDTSFGFDGVQRSITHRIGMAIMVQGGGKIIVSGSTLGIPKSKVYACRLNANGSLDSSFGASNGESIIDFDPNYAYCYSMRAASNGKIIIAGTVQDLSGYGDLLLVCLDSAGIRDSSFGGGDGIVLEDVNLMGSSSNDVINSFIVQSDGKIVAAGYTGDLVLTRNFLVARFNKDGSLDNSFGSNGYTNTAIQINREAIANSILELSDGKYIVTGYYSHLDSSAISMNRMALVKYSENGIEDNTFGSAGIATCSYEHNATISNSSFLQDESHILLSGSATLNNKKALALTRVDLRNITGISKRILNKSQFEVYPNPAIERVFIEYTLPEFSEVSFELLDILGNRLMDIASSGIQSIGDYQKVIELPNGIAGGVYLFRMHSNSGTNTIKLSIHRDY